MLEDSQAILDLVLSLSTSHPLPAWEELVRLCRYESVMNQLQAILASPSIQVGTRLVAASVVGRMLVKHEKEYDQGYGEKYLMVMMTDLSLPFQIKKMMGDCLTHHARHSPQFLERLMLISEDMVTSIQSSQHKIRPPALQTIEKDELQELIAKFTQLLRFDFANKQNWVNACQTIILIGQAIVRLIFIDPSEREKKNENRKEKTKSVQPDFSASVLRLMKCLKVLHKLIVNQANILKNPQLLQKLFRFYVRLADVQAQVAPARECLMEMMDWYFLPASIFEIYKLDPIACSKDRMIEENLLNLRSTASNFFTMFIRKIKETKGRNQIKNVLEIFITHSRQTLSTFDTKKIDPFFENLMHLICYYHLERADIPVEEMMGDFQDLISPFITRLLTQDKSQLFASSPQQLHAKLTQIVQGNSHATLGILSHLLIHFTSSSLDFFIYLFQTFRLSIQRRLNCDYRQAWNIPEYLMNSTPLEIITVFYIMAIIPYDNPLASGLFEYLKQLITLQFVDQLDYMDISMFYFFLQFNWQQLYENQQEGLFLLAHVFKKEINPSAKYFMYEFVSRLSDYFVDESYILAYVQHLPLLYPHSNKWDNVFKWVSYLQDLEEGFSERLVRIINEHIQNEVSRSLKNQLLANQHHEQLRNHIKILTYIAKMENIAREDKNLQVLLLEGYQHIQKILNLDVEDCLHQLLACLCKYFKYHRQFYERILPQILEKHSLHWSRPSKYFYLLLAEYVYHSEDKISIMRIYSHIDDVSTSLDFTGEDEESRHKMMLLTLGNILIIFQNLLLRHPNMLGDDVIYNITLRALSFEQLLPNNLQKKLTKQFAIIMARCLNIQLAIFAILSCSDIAYGKYIAKMQSGGYQYYDTQFLVAILGRLNIYSSKQKRSTILYIISLIMISESDREDNQQMPKSYFYYLPDKMSPVFAKATSVFRQIKQFMAFYRIPDLDRMRELTIGFPSHFFTRFKTFFDLMMSKDAKMLKKRQKASTIMDKGKNMCAKKRSAAFSNDDQDGQQGKLTVLRWMTHETLTKRVKRETNTLRMANENSQEEAERREEEEKVDGVVDFFRKKQTAIDSFNHSALRLLILNLNSQPSTSNKQKEKPENHQYS